MQTLNRFRQQLETLPHFVVLAAPTVPPDTGLKAIVRNILESPPDRIYRDGIESVDRAEIVNGAIEGEFSDQIGVRAVKRVGFRLAPDEIETWILNPDEVAKFSGYQGEILALFAPMYGKGSKAKKKNCTTGLSCGNSCIAQGKKCRIAPSPETQKKIESAIGSGGEGDLIAKAGAQSFNKMSGAEIEQVFEGQEKFEAIGEAFSVELGGIEEDRKVEWFISNKSNFYDKIVPKTKQEINVNSNALRLVQNKWNKQVADVSFSVDGSTMAKAKNARDGIKIAIEIKKQWPEMLDKIPEGTILTNLPVGGPEGKRAKIYSRMGFGEQDELTGLQTGMVLVQDGKKKVVPLQLAAPMKPVVRQNFDDLDIALSDLENLPDYVQTLMERMRRDYQTI